LQCQKYRDNYFKESSSAQTGKKKLQPFGIFVRFNFRSVCLRYTLVITIPLHIEDFEASAIVFTWCLFQEFGVRFTLYMFGQENIRMEWFQNVEYFIKIWNELAREKLSNLLAPVSFVHTISSVAHAVPARRPRRPCSWPCSAPAHAENARPSSRSCRCPRRARPVDAAPTTPTEQRGSLP
jgi:hypothetical protein